MRKSSELTRVARRLVDHENKDFKVWESKACMKYLVSKCAFSTLFRSHSADIC